ncbi:MAG: two pore domain potassium channel family protein [Solirubrobacteraceae bacterium]
MRIVVGVVGGVLVALMLFEIFLAFLLPRRVKRDPLLARRVAIYLFRPWRAVARRLPDQIGDTLLGMYGPFGLLLDLALWVLVLMLGYACLVWAGGSQIHAGGATFGQDFYYAATGLVSAAADGFAAGDTFTRVLEVLDAATGFGVLTIVIAYLPSLYQAFSRRETTVSMLDARAGSPPSAGRLIVRAAQRGGWPAVDDYLHGWEEWSAELMETHLSYPTLAFFRSQHVNQNWLSALCTILDASALAISAAPSGSVHEARFTFAISRHAIADLAYTFRAKPTGDEPDRLPQADFDALLGELRAAGVELGAAPEAIHAQLTRMRQLYEPYAEVLAQTVELRLPPWLAPENPTDNWRTTAWH